MVLEELIKEKTKELDDTRKELRSEKEAFIKMYNQFVQEKEEKERLNNIINELEKELDLNLPFKVVGVRHLKNKLQELKGSE